MKILIYSPNFLPKIGGLENTIAAITQAYVNNGNQVKVITYTSLDNQVEITNSFDIYRNPTILKIIRLFKWCEVVHYPNISLKGMWPLLFFKRTFCVSHHTTNYNLDGSISFLGKLKYLAASLAHNSSCSAYTNSLLYKKGIVINSPYNEKQFYNIPDIKRDKELVFLGRLVSDKGCNLIIEALNKLKLEKKIEPKLTIVGDGPEFNSLKDLSAKYDLTKQVEFTGAIIGSMLNQKLNEHKVLIVPSIWEEPFGKVAIEGLAAGCKVIVARSGGLPEAIGEFGLSFKKNDALDLAEKIEIILTEYEIQSYNSSSLEHHLKNFTIEHIGFKYNNWIKNCFNSK